MDMQNVSNLTIPEGEVKAIHDKNGELLWGRTSYDVKYKGDTFQQTYTGKNLVHWVANTDAGIGNGIVATDNSDGSIHLSGTATGRYPQITNRASVNIPPGTYTLSIGTSTFPKLLRLAGTYSGGSRIGIGMIAVGDSSLSVTTTDTLVELDLWFNVEVGDVIDATIKPMFEAGSSPTSYEPYTGGIPAPNPDYPQDIKVATGTQTINIYGKNMYIGSQDFSGVWGNSSSWTTDTETYNGLVVKYKADAWNGLYKEIEVDAGKTYTFSAFIKAGSARNVNFYLGGGSATVSPSSKSISVTTDWQRYSVTFTASVSGTIRARVENTSNQTTPTYVCGYQLEESGVMTAYERCYNQTYTINLGSTELCKLSTYQDYIYENNGEWYVHKEVGKYTFTGNENIGNASEAGTGYKSYYTSPSYFNNILVQKDAPCLMYGFRQSNYAKPKSEVCFMVNSSANVIWVGQDTMTIAGLKSIITNTNFYYPFSIASDTKITDATLVGQLNAVHEWMTRYGYNATVTGNLPIIIDRTNL